MIKRIKISALITALVLFTSCVDRYIDDNDRHYESGVVAFENWESALTSPILALEEAQKLDDFMEYIDQNSQTEGSTSLETWQLAETTYFPENRLRNDGDIWYIASSSDTIWTIDTNSQGMDEPGSVWELYFYKDPSAAILTRIGPKLWGLELNGLRPVYDTYGYYGENNFTVDGGFQMDCSVAGGISVTGYMEVNVGDHYSSSYSHILNGTMDTPLWYSLLYNIKAFTQGDYSFDITRISDGKSEPVTVAITPVVEGNRIVSITYKNDTVTFD